MTIIAILLAFGLCHFVRELGRFRKRQWLTSWVDFSNDAFGKLPLWQDTLGFLVIIGVPLLVLLLINHLLISALGTTGSFLLALAVLIYSFGPRDLDTDVADIIESDDEEDREAAIANLLRKPSPEDPEEARAAAVEAVFREALRRWFGVIFWFAVLGVAGAFLYRLIDWLVNENHNLTEDQVGLFTRLQQIMDWPAAQLMTLSLAIATDFDSVFAAWKRYHDEQGHGLFDGDNGFLLSSARRIVLTGHAARDGYADEIEGPMICLQQAMDLTWRILGVWLTVLALLLLIGVIV
ncbi:MAG: cobalamin biosynthesis protein [Xanthomonadales bacterium]|nr:cobalamin biosynthesis protein [Xanthomonadales bacterium]